MLRFAEYGVIASILPLVYLRNRLSTLFHNYGGIRTPMHPVWLRCSSVIYPDIIRSSRLARRAPRRSRCVTVIMKQGTKATPDSRFVAVAAITVLALLSRASLGVAQEEETEPKQKPASASEASPESSEDDRFNPWFFRLAYQPSWVVQSNGFVKGDNATGEPIESGQGFKIELGWQSDGSEDWEQLYNFPALGLGVYKPDFGSEELGAPVVVYGFFSWPLLRGSRATLATEFNFGIAFNWEPYDPESNPFNGSVSTATTFYTDWGFFVHYAVAKRLDLSAGGTYTHYSNGGLGDPNDGLNTLSLLGGLRYNFDRERPRFVRRELPPFKGFYELVVAAAGGSKEVDVPTSSPELRERDLRQKFGVANVTFASQRQFYSMGKLAAGVDWTYDGSANAKVELVDGNLAGPPTGASDKRAIGIYGGYEHVIDRFSIPIQLGYYVWRGRDDDVVPRLYQRLGFRYRLRSNLFVGLSTRFRDFERADFVEWTVGASFRKK